MSLWSKIKKAIKKVVKAIKAAVRVIVRLVVTVVMAVVNVFDLLFGFLNWPNKKLTLYILVLSKLDPAAQKEAIVNLQASIDETKRVLKDRFNVTLRPYSRAYVEWFGGTAPTEALNPSCCGNFGSYKDEFGEAGDFYAKHLAGWVGIPISLRFPITVFIVDDVQCKKGCSNGPLADYVVEEVSGLNEAGNPFPFSLMVHEMGHACSLPHSTHDNIMWGPSDRGDKVKWWQKNLLRSSRHVTYW